jgi:hypothetical protein
MPDSEKGPPPSLVPNPATLEQVRSAIDGLLLRLQLWDEKQDRRFAEQDARYSKRFDRVDEFLRELRLEDLDFDRRLAGATERLQTAENRLDDHGERIEYLERKRPQAPGSSTDREAIVVREPGKYRAALPPQTMSVGSKQLTEAAELVFKSISPPARNLGKVGDSGVHMKIEVQEVQRILTDAESAKIVAEVRRKELESRKRTEAVKTAILIAAVLVLAGLAVNALARQIVRTPVTFPAAP